MKSKGCIFLSSTFSLPQPFTFSQRNILRGKKKRSKSISVNKINGLSPTFTSGPHRLRSPWNFFPLQYRPLIPFYFTPSLCVLFFFFFNLCIYFGYATSLLLQAGYLQLQGVGTTLHCGAQVSHCGGLSCCRAWALGSRASVIVACGLSSWHMSLAALLHVESSWTRD